MHVLSVSVRLYEIYYERFLELLECFWPFFIFLDSFFSLNPSQNLSYKYQLESILACHALCLYLVRKGVKNSPEELLSEEELLL